MQGRAISGEKDLPRRNIIGIERVPAMRGIILRSRSGFEKGWKRWVRIKNRGG
jgi:hypothetical protein